MSQVMSQACRLDNFWVHSQKFAFIWLFVLAAFGKAATHLGDFKSVNETGVKYVSLTSTNDLRYAG
jgi:hypothetical protein